MAKINAKMLNTVNSMKVFPNGIPSSGALVTVTVIVEEAELPLPSVNLKFEK